MPKYQYERLYVSTFEPRDFDPRDPLALRQAVEYLKTIPPSPFVMIVAQVSVEAGTFKLNAPATLTLDKIIGNTPIQVWNLLDQQIDRQIQYFEDRSRGSVVK